MDQWQKWVRSIAGHTAFASNIAALMLFFAVALPALGDQSVIPQHGMLWEVESANGAKSYLLGSVHSEDPRVKRRLETLAPIFY